MFFRHVTDYYDHSLLVHSQYDHLHAQNCNYILYRKVQHVMKLKYLQSSRKTHKILTRVSLMSARKMSDHIFLHTRTPKIKASNLYFSLKLSSVCHCILCRKLYRSVYFIIIKANKLLQLTDDPN